MLGSPDNRDIIERDGVGFALRGAGCEVGLDGLRLGDAVRVEWLDASESTRVLPSSEGVFDTPIWSYGVFPCVKGLRTRHLVIAKEVIVQDRVFHYNVIRVGMVERVVLLRSGDLDSKLLREMSRRVEETPVKKLKMSRRGGRLGWV